MKSFTVILVFEMFTILMAMSTFVDNNIVRLLPARTVRFAAIVSYAIRNKREICNLICGLLVRSIATAIVAQLERIRMIHTSITHGQAKKAHCRRKVQLKCTHWEKHCARDTIDCYHRMVSTRPSEFT